MRALIQKFAGDTSGATAIEYSLVAGLVSVIIVAALASLGTRLTTKFTNIGNAFN